MGHRALVAYQRPDGLYNCHYSHWGAHELRLKHDVTPETPFGGDDTTAEWASELLDELLTMVGDADVGGYLGSDDRPATAVDPRPLATQVTIDEIATEHVDYRRHEAVYVVTTDFAVTAYRTLWFGLEYDCETVDESETVGNGALRTVRWDEGEPVGDEYVRGEFRALKAVVGDLVDRGVVTPAEGRGYMREKLGEWTDATENLIVRTP